MTRAIILDGDILYHPPDRHSHRRHRRRPRAVLSKVMMNNNNNDQKVNRPATWRYRLHVDSATRCCMTLLDLKHTDTVTKADRL